MDELPSTDDPRYGLDSGLFDAEVASSGIDQVGHVSIYDTPFAPPNAPMPGFTGISWANSDISFTGDHVIQGNYRGFQIFDVSDPAEPTLRTTMLCPGGQGDTNVYGNLLFQSVEDNTARVDCGSEGAGLPNVPNPDRFRGVRIWDISDLDNPVQKATIQTCRGSHTNRLVEDPNDPDHVYIYNSGTGAQRHIGEKVNTPDGFVDGRCQRTSIADPDPSQWMIEVIKVPVDNPAAASVVKEARLFADPDTGAVDGLQNGPTQPQHPCATTPNPFGSGNSCAPASANYAPSPVTNTCHDITAYPEIGLAAGACQGNGILIDISDPADPVRIDAVADPNFAYWHSANFNNDGTTVMFTDEWGGGTGARCAPAHRTSWGANALFSIDRSGPTPKMVFESYYKLPAAQTNAENCVAHQANILPVPGRDVVIQAWYQGGMSLFDMTDPGNPFEIGYWDRGSITTPLLALGGFWSSYWYNGNVFGSEIARGLDVMEVTPTDQLTVNELAAAKTVQLEEHNAMAMRSYTWPPSFPLVRAYADQLERVDGGVAANKLANVRKAVDKAEAVAETNPKNALAQLRAASNQLDTKNPAHADLYEAIQALMEDLG
ncbi:LVIVD repeat-containing protein [Ornithinimicrobium cerasi]|uniref:LVIVD repeat-containing protein n=1 Tax=Ornithinimicrobium cerasi TaxID=2248773 RepID=UPI00137A3DDA|nr:hypothetical protein [Ornithinimicrobium cerasi]